MTRDVQDALELTRITRNVFVEEQKTPKDIQEQKTQSIVSKQKKMDVERQLLSFCWELGGEAGMLCQKLPMKMSHM